MLTVGKLRSILQEINPEIPVVFAVGKRDYINIEVLVINENNDDQPALKLAEYDHWR